MNDSVIEILFAEFHNIIWGQNTTQQLPGFQIKN